MCHKNHVRIGRIDGSVLSTRYRPSSIPSGRLEMPLMMTFKNPSYIKHQKMKDFMTKLIVMTINQSQKMQNRIQIVMNFIYIEIKDNVVEEGEDSKVVVAPKI